MKWVVALLFIPCSVVADIAYMHAPSRQTRWFRPESVTIGSAAYASPSDGRLNEAGYALVEYDATVPFEDRVISWDPPAIRAMTQEELSDREAQVAAEQALIAARAADPARFDNGVISGNGFIYVPATPSGSNGWVIAVSTRGDLLTSHWYGSPTSTVEEIMADLSDKAVEAVETAERMEAVVSVTEALAAQVVLATNATIDKIKQFGVVFTKWTTGVSYSVGVIVRRGNDLYRVVQAHTSQSDWAPELTPALFVAVVPPGAAVEWVQPTGAHNAYAAGAVVLYAGKTWTSTVSNNVWKPGVHGWVEVTR